MNPHIYFVPYIFNIMSTKNSVSLLEAFAERMYFSAAALVTENPMLVSLCLVECYLSFPFFVRELVQYQGDNQAIFPSVHP